MPTAIGIDIGGTKLLAGLVSWPENGPLSHSTVSVTDTIRIQTPDTTEDFFAALQRAISALNDKAGANAPLPIGISSAGMIRPSDSHILGSTGNLPALQGVNSFSEGLNNPPKLHALNDANAAAYGEYAVLNNDDSAYTNVLMITLGTGIGGGFVINGAIFDGEQGGAMEVGHICLDPRSQRHCTCGKIGCWEAYASGTGLQSTLTKTLADAAHQHATNADILLKQYQASQPVSTYDLMRAAEANDAVAQSVLHTWHMHLAQGLASVVSVLNPGLLILGGGLGNAVDIPKLTATLTPMVLQPVPAIRVAQWGNEAGLVGAALLAQKRYATTTQPVAV